MLKAMAPNAISFKIERLFISEILTIFNNDGPMIRPPITYPEMLGNFKYFARYPPARPIKTMTLNIKSKFKKSSLIDIRCF